MKFILLGWMIMVVSLVAIGKETAEACRPALERRQQEKLLKAYFSPKKKTDLLVSQKPYFNLRLGSKEKQPLVVGNEGYRLESVEISANQITIVGFRQGYKLEE